MAEPVTVALVACPRCGGDHEQLELQPLDRPADLGGMLGLRPLTHWAPCPTNGQPVLVRDPHRIVCSPREPQPEVET